MKTMLKIAVGVTCVLWLSGCQLFGGPSDETLVQETMSSFQESLLAQDVDAVLELYSENYSDAQGTTKSAVRTFLTAMSGGDGAAGLKLTIDEAVIVMNEDGTATATPVKLAAQGFNITATVTFTKEEGSWLISSMEMF